MIHFRAVPILDRRAQTVLQRGRLSPIDPAIGQVDRPGRQERHNRSPAGVRWSRFQQFDVPVAVNPFNRFEHDLVLLS